jgi:predicted AAA+ superfamily ATPase
MEELYQRNLYIDKIRQFIDKPLVKIITGLRRSGKSKVLELIQREILQRADKDHIIVMNFEEKDFFAIKNYEHLTEYIDSKIKDTKKYYIFLDEPQEVIGWEKAVNAFRLKKHDIYVTGSNSSLLSREFATLLGGRDVTFNIFTLSYKEFVDFRKQSGMDYGISSYIKTGGYPLLSTVEFNDEGVRKIVKQVESETVLRDVIERKGIKSPAMLRKLRDFIYDNVGNQISVDSIVKYLKNEKVGAGAETIETYLGYLEEAFVLIKVARYDIKSKELLKTNDKYYLGDHSLQYAIRGVRTDRTQGVLENIVCIELLRRGYDVKVGRVSDKNGSAKEVDFIATNELENKRLYVQVCQEFSKSKNTQDREFLPLISINDHYPKYVVTTDDNWNLNINGVAGIRLEDFLLKEDL